MQAHSRTSTPACRANNRMTLKNLFPCKAQHYPLFPEAKSKSSKPENSNNVLLGLIKFGIHYIKIIQNLRVNRPSKNCCKYLTEEDLSKPTDFLGFISQLTYAIEIKFTLKLNVWT